MTYPNLIQMIRDEQEAGRKFGTIYRRIDDVIDRSNHESIDMDNRTISFVLSTPGRKADRIDINPNGWILDDAKRNGPFLWSHNRRVLPLGRLVPERLRTVGRGRKKNLMGDVQFADADENPQGDMAFRLFVGRFLNAVSIGFDLMRFEFVPDGIDSHETKLLEASAVTLPLDTDALVEGREAGIDISPAIRSAELFLDTFTDRDADDVQALENSWERLKGTDRLVIVRVRTELAGSSIEREYTGNVDDIRELLDDSLFSAPSVKVDPETEDQTEMRLLIKPEPDTTDPEPEPDKAIRILGA